MRGALRLGLCRDCLGERAEATVAALRDRIAGDALPGRVVPVLTGCLGPCKPAVICLQGEGLASYVFAGLDPDADAGDILATCREWLAAEAGWIEDARPCGRLRFCLSARVPA